MTTFVMIICAVLALCFLVFIHEAGHFLASRAFGVRVTELMLGLPGPSIGFTKGSTRYGVTAVLLGGYARVCGMEAGEMSPHLRDALAALYRRGTATMEDVAADCGITDDEAYAALEELVEWGSCSGPTKADQFNMYRAPEARPTGKQLRAARAAHPAGVVDPSLAVRPAAAAAGSAAADGSAPASAPASALVDAPSPAPAAASSAPAPAPAPALASYALGEPRPVNDPQALFDREYAQQYRSLPFWKRSIILLAGPFVNLLFTMVAFVVIYSVVGIDLRYADTGEVFHFNATPLQSIQMGFAYIGMVVQAVAGLFNPATAAQTVESSASIVGIVAMSGDFFEKGFVDSLFFMAMISVSLGIMNLLPIPPLDGGRFAVEVFQKLTRKTVPTKVMGYLTIAGMVLFLGFFAIMLSQDVQRLFTGFYS
ncbi:MULTISPECIES: site-2 protease family protein [unclassified Adlercreutzia]|uniref:site-2 protease family protein n=1 Tax=unclassified Adlercreutzia TaxID=2636013 RepID=UPI0013EA421F|nr:MULTISPECIES: site-2 protease family protein [unclassified Adlercreutzia]